MTESVNATASVSAVLRAQGAADRPAPPEPAYITATRASYNAMAAGYTAHFRGGVETQPFSLAMLAAFAELVRADGDGRKPVLEVGSGPGWVTAHLHSLGLDISGRDLSSAMVALAREAHPHVRFEEGAMADLPVPDGTLGGLVAWYSLINTPPSLHPAVLAEFHRALAPGGHLLLAFQVGSEEISHHDEAFGVQVSLDFHRLSPDRLTEHLRAAGFTVPVRMVRERQGEERTPQGFLVAHKAKGVQG